MPDANKPDDVVRARLRTVMPVDDQIWYAASDQITRSFDDDALTLASLHEPVFPEPVFPEPVFPESVIHELGRPELGHLGLNHPGLGGSDVGDFESIPSEGAFHESVFLESTSSEGAVQPGLLQAGWGEPAVLGSVPGGPALARSDSRRACLPGDAGTGGRASVGPENGALAGRLTALGAFDPGRRGVKALAAVAIVAVIAVALVTWRSRPQVEPLAGKPVAEVLASTGVGGESSPAVYVAGAPAGGGTASGAGSGSGSGPGAPRGSSAEIVVAVGGKVHRPGLVHLASGARVADALQAAGGADRGVDVAPLNLARKVVDGELIMVGVALPPGMPASPRGVGGAAGPATGGVINLNTATMADLDTLPGVGPVLAQRIIDRRDQQGGFAAVSDLRKVEGIGAARYEQLKDLVTV